jgi:hypothetical protein
MYLVHLVTGGPLGIPTPSEVKLAVDAAFKQAREETGFTPLRPQPKTKRKKRR